MIMEHEEEIRYMAELLKDYENAGEDTKINYVFDVINEEGEKVKEDSVLLDKGILKRLLKNNITVMEALKEYASFIEENGDRTDVYKSEG